MNFKSYTAGACWPLAVAVCTCMCVVVLVVCGCVWVGVGECGCLCVQKAPAEDPVTRNLLNLTKLMFLIEHIFLMLI